MLVQEMGWLQDIGPARESQAVNLKLNSAQSALLPRNNQKLQELSDLIDKQFEPLFEKFPEALRFPTPKFYQAFDQKMAGLQETKHAHEGDADSLTPIPTAKISTETLEQLCQFERSLQYAQRALLQLEAYAQAALQPSAPPSISDKLNTQLQHFVSESKVTFELLTVIRGQMAGFALGQPYQSLIQDDLLNLHEVAREFREKYSAGVSDEALRSAIKGTAEVLNRTYVTLSSLKQVYEKEFQSWDRAALNTLSLQLMNNLPNASVDSPTTVGALMEKGHNARIEPISSLASHIEKITGPLLREMLELFLPTSSASETTKRS